MFICMYYLIKTCHPGYCHNSFMAIGALGHTHVRLHVVGIQDTNNAQVNTRQTIIINTNIYITTHTHKHPQYIYIYIR